jgi:hypothetical protein
MVVGFWYCSETDITGISTGNPPAAQTARFTASARSRRWVWQGLISDQVLRMPMTGLPMNSSWPSPICSARERWPKERKSDAPNQRFERKVSGVLRGWDMGVSSGGFLVVRLVIPGRGAAANPEPTTG